jgi:hypothetical protein
MPAVLSENGIDCDCHPFMPLCNIGKDRDPASPAESFPHK